jgi:hypothetical protein
MSFSHGRGCHGTGTGGLERSSGCFRYKNTKLKKKGKEARMLQLAI